MPEVFFFTDQEQNPAKFGLAKANPAKSSKEPARSGLAGPIPGVRQPIGASPGGGLGDGRPGRHGQARARGSGYRWVIRQEADLQQPIGTRGGFQQNGTRGQERGRPGGRPISRSRSGSIQAGNGAAGGRWAGSSRSTGGGLLEIDRGRLSSGTGRSGGGFLDPRGGG
jgi:hypothetical protein